MRFSSLLCHWIAGVFIFVAIAMVVLGETVLAGHLRDYDYVFYWGACMIVTLLAAFAAVFDMVAIRRESRREHHRLAEDTFKNTDSSSFSGESEA
jgi:integral membrane sensor domain MASE1